MVDGWFYLKILWTSVVILIMNYFGDYNIILMCDSFYNILFNTKHTVVL